MKTLHVRSASQPRLDWQPLSERSDDSLLRCYREGDEAAAASLYRRYAPRLRLLAKKHCTPAYAGRFDAEDVLQSVFATFFQGVKERKYSVPSNGELWALLTVMSLNKVRELVDRHRALKRAIQSTDNETKIDGILTSDDSAAGLLRMVMEEQLAGLPESNQGIIRLRVLGYSLNEIAERTGRALRTVERVLHDFRNRISEH